MKGGISQRAHQPVLHLLGCCASRGRAAGALLHAAHDGEAAMACTISTGAVLRCRMNLLPYIPDRGHLPPGWSVCMLGSLKCQPQLSAVCMRARAPGRFTKQVLTLKLTPSKKDSHFSIRRRNEWTKAEHLEALMVLQLLCQPEPAAAPGETL